MESSTENTAHAATDAGGTRSRVVIVGGGVVGLTAAYELRKRLGRRADVQVLSDRGQFLLPMGLLSVPFSRRTDDIGFSLGPALAKKGIGFRVGRVDGIDPVRRVLTTQGEEVPYDYVLIATGPDIDTQAVPGLGGEFSAAHVLHTEIGALNLSESVERFLHDPGPAVVGLAPGASYLSPAYEFVLSLDYLLRKGGNRDQASLAFVTPEPHLGHLDVGTPQARKILEAAFAERHIDVHADVAISRVGGDYVELQDGVRLPSRLTAVVPAFRGTAFIWKTSGLADSRGYVPVDDHYRHRNFPEIFAAGMAADSDITSSVPATLPKTGYLATAMAKAAARSIAAAVKKRESRVVALPRLLDIRVVDGGDVGLLLVGFGRSHLLRFAFHLRGDLAHRLKGLLNHYVLWKLRTGRTYLP
jgi:sulfide:quinone oxidoreductase